MQCVVSSKLSRGINVQVSPQLFVLSVTLSKLFVYSSES